MINKNFLDVLYKQKADAEKTLDNLEAVTEFDGSDNGCHQKVHSAQVYSANRALMNIDNLILEFIKGES